MEGNYPTTVIFLISIKKNCNTTLHVFLITVIVFTSIIMLLLSKFTSKFSKQCQMMNGTTEEIKIFRNSIFLLSELFPSNN